MFGKNDKPVFDTPAPAAQVKECPVFIEFEGALCTMDESTNDLVFTPRGKISIQLGNIGGYYDHTILLFGNKIRVMETAAQIALKIMEATHDVF